MTSPTLWAERTPDKPAIIMAGVGDDHGWHAGHTISYRELD